jgi:hypothetical protein
MSFLNRILKCSSHLTTWQKIHFVSIPETRCVMLCITRYSSHILYVNITTYRQNGEVWILQQVVLVYCLLCIYQQLYLRGLSGLCGQIHGCTGGVCKICGWHNTITEDLSLQGCGAEAVDMYLLLFWRTEMPLSLGIKQFKKSTFWCFLDCQTLRMKVLWFFKTSGTTHSVIQHHL